MPVFNNILAGAAGQAGGAAADFEIQRSLRFNDGDSANLSKTFSSAGNRRTFTFSCWIKRAKLARQAIFSAGSGVGSSFGIEFNGDDVLDIYDYYGGFTWRLITTPVFRDPASFFHLVVSVDTTQATASNRVKVYINNTQVTNFDTASYPSQNHESFANNNVYHTIGSYQNNTLYFNGLLSDIHFVDGQALAATDFGQPNATTGAWDPKSVSVNYGTNGFRLDFSDNSSDAALGYDAAGSNNWTVNNISSGAQLADNGFDHFVYTGTAAAQSFSNLKFQPDLLWFKSLTRVDSHGLYDVIRGRASNLYPDLNAGENTSGAGADLSSFDSNGFTLGGVQQTALNRNGEDYIVWAWKAGGSPSTNTDGNISASVSASTAYGFSVVKYTGDGATNGSVGHSLGSTPKMVIVKRIDGTNDWKVRHTSLGSTEMMSLNESYAAGAASWNGENSTVFYPARSGDTYNNVLNANYIAYCWSEISGYSKFGAYSGSSSNVTITTGFKPAYIIIKSNTDAGQEWIIKSAARGGGKYVMAENDNAESTGRDVTFDANGFTLSPNSGATNYSGRSYVYAAFAEGENAAIDSLIDTPTNADASSGNNIGNYATLNPLYKLSEVQLANGNLDVTWSGGQGHAAFSTIAMQTGKYYFEVTSGANTAIGIRRTNKEAGNWPGTDGAGYGYAPDGRKVNSGTYTNFGTAHSNGDVIGVAFDADSGKLWFSHNGTWQASGDPAAGNNPAYTVTVDSDYGWYATVGYWTSPSTNVNSFNAGQRPFHSTPPTGFLSLCTHNIPTPAITKSSEHFDCVTYNGSGQAQTISGLDLQPDIAWIKERNGTSWHRIIDSVRGQKELFPNDDNIELSFSQGVNSFTSDGFTLGTGSDSNVNTSSKTYVGWLWKAATSFSNSAGSNGATIASSGKVNQDAGISIVTYSYTGTSQQSYVHGLNVTPDLVIRKARNLTENWSVYHSAMGFDERTNLDNTNNSTGTTTFRSDQGNPTNTLNYINNNNTSNVLEYVFAAVPGFSAFGKYEGTGTVDGHFQWCGFAPRWILLKNVDNSTNRNWIIIDTKRSTFNKGDAETVLFANDGADESIANDNYGRFDSKDALDILSNGFKIKEPNTSGVWTQINNTQQTHIWAAFAEFPFAYARAR